MSSEASFPEGAVPSSASAPGSTIKVVLVFPMDLVGTKEGGAENFVRGFIKHAPEDFDLEVVGVSSDRRRRPPGRPVSVTFAGRTVWFRPVIFVRDENRRGRIPVSLRFTLALLPSGLRSEGAVFVFNRIEPALAFRRKGSAAIGLIHTDILRQCVPGKNEILWARFPRAYARLERWAVGRLDAVFMTSRSVIDRYAGPDPRAGAKLSLLPNWVDPEIFPVRTVPKSRLREVLRRSHPSLPKEGPWVLFVGRLQPVKAPFRAVDGFRRFLEPGRPGTLIMVGEGNLKPALEDHIRREGLGSRVFLLGDRSQAELSLFYRAADVLLLTSHHESMPCSVLESLGSGTPVVATDVGEVRGVIRDGRSGLIIDGEPEAIAAALGRVIGSPGVYSPEDCRACVASNDPRTVLPQVFDTIRELGHRIRTE